MSNRLFGVNNPVTHCERRRVPRTWWGTVLTGLTLLALAALCGWLWSCVRQATVTLPGPGWSRSLAMAPWTQGSILGLLAFLMVIAVWAAVRKVRSDDAWFAALRRLGSGEPSYDEADVFAALREPGMPGMPVPPADAQRILVACAAEARLIMQHVRRAQRTLSVEDYGDELVLAERRLESVIRCVEALAAAQRKDSWPPMAAREDVS